MKKRSLCAVVLALMMAFALNTTAIAEGETHGGGRQCETCQDNSSGTGSNQSGGEIAQALSAILAALGIK